MTLTLLASIVLFVCVEVPWANTEKFIFSNLLGIGQKPKKN
jgi:hypothetical protein